MMDAPLEALEQSYLRTKATDYASFQEVMRLNGNASNNTVFADTKGTIAYWHGNFMPRRDPKYDWSQPVDGSTPATEWQGLHTVRSWCRCKTPPAASFRTATPRPSPWPGPQQPRPGIPHLHGPRRRKLPRPQRRARAQPQSVFTLDTLIAAANDPHLTASTTCCRPAGRLPAHLGRQSPTAGVAEALPLLRAWNRRYARPRWPRPGHLLGRAAAGLARPRVPAAEPADYISFTAFILEHTTPAGKSQPPWPKPWPS